MNGDQAYRFALANARRDAAGNIDEKHLVETVAHAVDFDPDEQRLRLAQRIVGRRKRTGQTEAAGKVCLPGLEAYAFEPDRLIADGQGNVIENSRATLAHKRAEAVRSDLAAERAEQRHQQDQAEADELADWVKAELANGRDPRELTWGNCVRERGLLDGGAA